MGDSQRNFAQLGRVDEMLQISGLIYCHAMHSGLGSPKIGGSTSALNYVVTVRVGPNALIFEIPKSGMIRGVSHLK